MQYKTLMIKGAILGKNQLEDYLEKVASSHKYSRDRNITTLLRFQPNCKAATYT